MNDFLTILIIAMKLMAGFIAIFIVCFVFFFFYEIIKSSKSKGGLHV